MVCPAGGSERAWRQLLSPGSHLEAPTASGMRINICPDDPSLIVVGELTHCQEYLSCHVFSTMVSLGVWHENSGLADCTDPQVAVP